MEIKTSVFDSRQMCIFRARISALGRKPICHRFGNNMFGFQTSQNREEIEVIISLRKAKIMDLNLLCPRD